MTKFWDSSALVPLVLEEPHSRACRDLYRADAEGVVWQYTRTEAVSAVYKLTRTLPLEEDERDAALFRLDLLAAQWRIVRAIDDETFVDTQTWARRLMLKHPLKAGDALQLAAALIYFEQPRNKGFVAVDGPLATAAELEKFNVLRPARSRGGRGRRS